MVHTAFNSPSRCETLVFTTSFQKENPVEKSSAYLYLKKGSIRITGQLINQLKYSVFGGMSEAHKE